MVNFFTNRLSPLLTLFLALVLSVSPAATGQQQGKSQSGGPEPAALDALKRMGDALAEKKSLSFDADLATEVVMENGQKLLIGGDYKMRFRRPDHLRTELRTDNFTRLLFHNGEKLVMVAPEEGYFGELDLNTDSRSALIKIASDYGLEVPLADLLEWGTPDAPKHDIKEAFLVGPAEINDKKVEHWAFRGAKLDWEIWLPEKGPALPAQISIVNVSDPGSPRFTATLKWHVAESLPDKLFRPQLPKDAKRIPFRKVKQGEKKQ
ncbi:DUF2092 domain-containing protein [Microbulbifer hainanensis]|uniref:DUF2092 domain-containing protein n=1 Tax=Microbulbifer hainanensis TaxID=2735675 RepID=UPI0018669108|nr:DUF2092 domain-containing protein [Microbulbifer hainanensis]